MAKSKLETGTVLDGFTIRQLIQHTSGLMLTDDMAPQEALDAWRRGIEVAQTRGDVQAAREMAGWLAQGRLKRREDIVDGLERAPDAFIGLLQGKNFGKLLVRVAT